MGRLAKSYSAVLSDLTDLYASTVPSDSRSRAMETASEQNFQV